MDRRGTVELSHARLAWWDVVFLWKAMTPSRIQLLTGPNSPPLFVLVILGKSHYVLYGLVAAMQPRMLVTFDEEMRPLPVSVRVGQVSGSQQWGRDLALLELWLL